LEVLNAPFTTGAMPLADSAKQQFWIRYFNSPGSKNASPFQNGFPLFPRLREKGWGNPA
jgi:hypothetical protein